jgi:hypothetical protein
VPFNELTEFEFIKLLQLNLKLDTDYTILFQYTSYEQGIHFMLGPQTGIPVRETNELKFYRLLYEHYLEKLEILLDRYNIENPDFIVIYLKELILEETLKKVDPISQIALSKGLVRVGTTKHNFSTHILPVSKAEKNFGSLLQDKLKIEYLTKLIEKIQTRSVSDLSRTKISQTSYVLQQGVAYKSPIYSSIKEVLCGGNEQWSEDFSNNISNTIYINNLIAGLNTEQNQILFLQDVVSATSTLDRPVKEVSTVSRVRRVSDFFKVSLSRDRKYFIFSIMSPELVYYRIVFNNKTGNFLFLSKDNLNPQLINNFNLNPTKSKA